MDQDAVHVGEPGADLLARHGGSLDRRALRPSRATTAARTAGSHARPANVSRSARMTPGSRRLSGGRSSVTQAPTASVASVSHTCFVDMENSFSDARRSQRRHSAGIGRTNSGTSSVPREKRYAIARRAPSGLRERQVRESGTAGRRRLDGWPIRKCSGPAITRFVRSRRRRTNCKFFLVISFFSIFGHHFTIEL